MQHFRPSTSLYGCIFTPLNCSKRPQKKADSTDSLVDAFLSHWINTDWTDHWGTAHILDLMASYSVYCTGRFLCKLHTMQHLISVAWYQSQHSTFIFSCLTSVWCLLFQLRLPLLINTIWLGLWLTGQELTDCSDFSSLPCFSLYLGVVSASCHCLFFFFCSWDSLRNGSHAWHPWLCRSE